MTAVAQTAVASSPLIKPEILPRPVKLPTVKLDTTLADLYQQCSSLKNKNIGLVLCGLSSAMSLTEHFPRNRKYIYEEELFSSDQVTPQTRQRMAVKYLSLMTQRDAFYSGDSSSIFFHINTSNVGRAHDRKEVATTLKVLSNSQRPHLVFRDGPVQIPISQLGIDALACRWVLDSLESYDNIVSCETHWFVNSKKALADSRLPTPKCNATGVSDFPVEAEACCDYCRKQEQNDFVISECCRGPRGHWIKAQMGRYAQELESRSLPFILKTQATFGGFGTYFVRTERERQEVESLMRNGLLRRLLSSVNASNVHMEPATLLFSDVVENVVANYNLTFFVRDAGQESIYLGAAQQIIENGTFWMGNIIDYQSQDTLRAKFEPLVRDIAAWLEGHSYVGPAGADVLETGDGQFHIVDLNVRTTGSSGLPLMRGHFTRRGLRWASSFQIALGWGREEFMRAFREEFEGGQICIMSWYEDPDTGHSSGDVVIGTKDETELEVLTERIQEACSAVSFQ